MLVFVALLLGLFSSSSKCQYDPTNVAAGVKMAANEQLLVEASNTFSNFAIIMNPFNSSNANGTKRCSMGYISTDHFVDSVAVVGSANNGADPDAFIFVFSAEVMTTSTPFIGIVTISRSTCVAQPQMTFLDGTGKPQQYFLIGVDSEGTFAYAFTDSSVFKLQIATNTIVQNLTLNSLWPSFIFVPHSLDLTDSWAMIAGYGYSTLGKNNYAALGCLVDLVSLTSPSCQTLISESTYLVPAQVTSYSDLFDMSVTIRDYKILVGIQRLNTVIGLCKNGTSLTVTYVYTVSYPSSSSFGRLVQWIDNTTIAVVVYNSLQTFWSQSQVFVYDENSVLSTSALYTFPNSQQILGSRLSNPHFVRLIISSKGNMAILTDASDILIVPVAPPGYASVWIDTSALIFVFYYLPQPCIGGTYKSGPSLGPCTVCPPQTRNPGTLLTPVTTCLPCSENSSTSFCPLASLIDIDLSTVPSYSQATAYPATADTTDIEDILLENVFQISSDPQCLIISPLFWTLIVGTLSFLIWIIMTVIKVCQCKRGKHYREKAKKILKRTDLIGEGEMWVGGLATVSLIVLIAFSYWFSASFLQRYPIEQVIGPANFACDQELINAEFSTGLQLLSLPQLPEAQPIFTLLDSQIFILTVDLINTGFTCVNITVQENLVGTNYALLSVACTQSTLTAITSVTFTLPQHDATMQLNLTGPDWLGGLRVCVRGAGLINGRTTLYALDFCQFFSTSNGSIGPTSVIPITLTKSINMTKAMKKNDSPLYSGLWIPSFVGVSLSNEIYYDEFGNYLRYISSLTTIQLVFAEREFYIQNIEGPIARTPQVVFHALLFTSLCIEIFGLWFLLMKLFIIPFFGRNQRRWRSCCRRYNNYPVADTKSEHDMSTSTWQTHTDHQSSPDVEYSRSNQF